MVSVPQQAWQDSPKQDMKEWIYTDPLDPLDVTQFTPAKVGQEALRSIQLREGLELSILDMPLGDERSSVEAESVLHGVDLHFHIQGHHEDGLARVSDREFCIQGSGVFPKHRLYSPKQRSLEVWLHLEVEALRSMLADGSEELPEEVARWVRSEDELCYARVGKVTPAIRRVLWEVVRCPWQGVTKRLFLEGKALELLSLMVQWEQVIQEQDAVVGVPAGTRERVHYARELLLQNLHEPLTLEQLAQRSQLNECALKQGFGTTVFDYLLEYRLEQAREMLERGAMQVAEVMSAVGLKHRSYFAAAFRQKFGQNPKQYQQQFWQLQTKS